MLGSDLKGLKQNKILNLPNLITIGRLFTVPLIIMVLYFLARTKPANEEQLAMFSFIAAAIFCVAMLSDMIDGYLARRWNAVSTFGKFLDPLADKILFLSTAIMLVPIGRIPAWIVVVFFLREMTVTALRSMAVDEGIVIAASKWGKYKSAFTSASTVALLLHYSFWGVQWRLIGWVFIVPALILTFISGFDYCWGFYKAIKYKNNSVS